jgi:hypothetical protein
MSVRFSLRFEGRSICRLLGVAMCEEPGCEKVVAIIISGIFAQESVSSQLLTVDVQHRPKVHRSPNP